MANYKVEVTQTVQTRPSSFARLRPEPSEVRIAFENGDTLIIGINQFVDEMTSLKAELKNASGESIGHLTANGLILIGGE